MRVWHQSLIKYLPRNQLLGQHRELCALRGKGFGKKHSTVNYVFQHPYSDLFHFHQLVINEMEKRNYKVNTLWKNIKYRGKNIGFDYTNFTKEEKVNTPIYKEHNNEYLKDCLDNLKRKNINITNIN